MPQLSLQRMRPHQHPVCNLLRGPAGPTQPSPRVRAGGLSPPSRERCPPAQGAWRGQHLPGGPAPIHAAVAQGLEATCLPAW